MALTNSLREAVHLALVRGVRRNMDRIFNLSQNTEICYVPVDTGMLKKSGYVKPIENGAECGYLVNYAADVERGHPFRPFKGDQVIKVKAHTRKYSIQGIPLPSYDNLGQRRKFNFKGIPVAKSQVKEHEVVLHDKRVVAFRPKLSKFERGKMIFRVMRGEPEQKGQFFLTRALREGLKHLGEDVEFYLQRIKIKGA